MTITRDLQFEVEVPTRLCGSRRSIEAISDHAIARASSLSRKYVSDPEEIHEGRNRIKEIQEELADAFNHALFDWQVALATDKRPDPRLPEIIRGLVKIYNLTR